MSWCRYKPKGRKEGRKEGKKAQDRRPFSLLSTKYSRPRGFQGERKKGGERGGSCKGKTDRASERANSVFERDMPSGGERGERGGRQSQTAVTTVPASSGGRGESTCRTGELAVAGHSELDLGPLVI